MNDVWTAIEDPLSHQQYKRLAWAGMRLHATFFFEQHGDMIDVQTARRLAFARWMYITHRLNEGIS